MRRRIALLLVIVMILSSFSMIGAAPDRSQQLESALQQADISTDGPVTLDPDTIQSFDEDEEYRVIVELTGEAAIQETIGTNQMYHELSQTRKDTLEQGILSQQNQVINAIESQDVELNVLHNFTVSVNGFSAIVTGADLEDIYNTPGVKDVFISNEYERPEVTEPNMEFSHDMIGSRDVWTNLRYRGEGMVIAVADTGIQWTHQDFNPNYDFYKLTVDQRWVEGLDLPGLYRTPKVVYSYNYYDDTQTVENMNGNHGQHVAGTVAADGDIKGVAPLAQLVDLQVFGEHEPTTFDDIYLRGIDDALKIGVDAVNMSLGSVAAFYQPNNAVDRAITNAREDGVAFAISAGNSAHAADGISFPWRQNPDVGLVGSPSLNKDSISVASIDNIFTLNNYLTYEIDGDVVQAPYAPAGPLYVPDALDVEEYVFVGFGGVEEDYVAAELPPQNDFEGVDLEGKVALISRGHFAFVNKIMNAQEYGAKAVIIFNNDGTNELINMQYPDDGEVPALFIGSSFGDQLAAQEVPVPVSFPEGTLAAANPTGGEMSGFTSWGTTPTLDMKPEVTAPGGMIYSTVLDNQYGAMSGTSMAAPHVAGSTALVQQYLLNEGMDREDVAEMSKILHMNTAEPILDPYGNLYSPRRQGAGLIRPDKAIMSPVSVVNQADGEAKVQLRDFQDEVFTMTLEASNHSDEAVTYDVSVDVIVDELIAQLMWQWMDSAPIVGAVISGDEAVTIAPGTTETVSVTVDISNAAIPAFHPQIGYVEYPVVDYPNLFVEGFINLEERVENPYEGPLADYTINDTHEDQVIGLDLVVPFVGYYGDWAGENAPRILDGFGYFGEQSFFGTSGMVNQNGSFMGYHIEDEYAGAIDRLAISPGNPLGHTAANPVFGMMRSAAEVEFAVVDEAGNEVNIIDEVEWLRKSYAASPFYYISDWAWDGTNAEEEVVEDGQYYYEINALLHYEGAEWQSRSIPVMVDTVAPVVGNFDYNISNNELSWTATDEGIGVHYMELYIDDELYATIPANGDEYFVEDFSYDPSQILNVWVVDFAGNSALYSPAGLVELADIELVSEPDQTQYYVDEELDLEGLVVEAVYNDGSREVIPHADLVVEGFDSSEPVAELEVVVSYEGYSVSFMVDIVEYVPDMNDLRISGANRYQTAYEVAMEKYGETGAETVIIVRGDSVNRVPQVVDALSASGLAGVENAPILLTEMDTLRSETVNAIEALGAEHAIIIGGTAAINVDVENELADMDLSVQRISGANRYETAAEVARFVLRDEEVVPTSEHPRTAIIANGRSLVDSLVAGPLAHETGYPILLVEDGRLDAAMSIIDEYDIENLIVVGGTAVVSEDTVNTLSAMVDGDVDRYAGDDETGRNRYGTSINFAKGLFEDSEGAVLVNGRSFVDAVPASILGMPILYVEQNDLRDDVRDLLETKVTFRVIGGTAVISNSVLLDAYQTVYER